MREKMEGNVIKKLENMFDTLTKSQKKIAKFIITNPVKSSFMTIDQIAHENSTSSTTAIRLAQQCGFTNYSELQSALQDKVLRMEQPAEKLGAWMYSHSNMTTEISEIINIQMQNIHKTFETLSNEVIIKTVNYIIEAPQIHVVGNRGSFCIAHFLNYNLNRLYGKSNLLVPMSGDFVEQVDKIRKGHLVIAICMPRYYKETITAVQIGKKKGAKVISITDANISPMRNYSNVLLVAPCKSISFYRAFSPAMLIAEIIISVAASKSAASCKEHLVELEKIAQILDYYYS
jgi:DNA-binding MurR/RpiR family transcriptional regulator